MTGNLHLGLEHIRASLRSGNAAAAAEGLATLWNGSGDDRRAFLRRFATAHGLALPRLPAPAGAVRKPRLFIDAQHGLGNRMRAIASAAAIAEATGRDLVIVWQPDVHCGARFGDLFAPPVSLIEESFAEAASAAGAHVVTYMEVEPGARHNAPIPGEAAADADIYVRSAYPLNSPDPFWPAQKRFLHALVPADGVMDLIAPVRHPNALAAHVRMASGQGFDHLPWEAPGNWTPEAHAQLGEWRAKSHARHFIARIDALVAAGEADTIFLAADLPETYELFADRYGHRLATLPRALFDRSSRQAQYALADTLLLGRAPRFLGSTWSSMTDLARRLSRDHRVAEMSGRDF